MKIVTIIGARPQFIKAAVVSRQIKKYKDIEEIIVHTGQHFDENMNDIFFEQMDIPVPDYNLSVNSIAHGAMTGRMLEKIEEVLKKETPEWVLVYGDTNSTLAGALAAKKMHIKVAHVEAGLRSFNMKMPEEINRILTDRISDIVFCPTNNAIKNLENEGYASFDCRVLKSGDVMQDAALFYTPKSIAPDFSIPSQFVLSTIHRAENADNKKNLENIFSALNYINENLPVVLPLHPRTKKRIKEHNLQHLSKKLMIIDPVGYLEMVWLLQHCSLVMTDSGGLQKEAFFFKQTCITLREETEWTELVENGFNKVVGNDKDKIINSFSESLYRQPDFSIDLYGNGMAGENILTALRMFNKTTGEC